MNTLLILAVIAGILVCIVGSAFFSASEMSYSSVNTLRMENLSEKGDRRASRVLKIIRRFDDALSTILIGNNLVNIAASSLASVLVLMTGLDRLTWLATAVITVLIIIFGETIPKITAKKNANRFSLAFSGIISALMILFRPLVWVVTKLIALITRAVKPEETDPDEEEAAREFSSLIETAEDEGVLDGDCSELVQNAIEFPEVTAQECMTSRVDMHAIDIEDSLEDILEFVEKTPYTRIPVYEDSVDNIIGILHLNHLFKALADAREKNGGTIPEKPDLRALLMPPLYVYKTMDLPIVLTRMREASQHLAIVTDEYSGTEGIITLEDVLEEIVGDIWDETDVIETEVEQVSENCYAVDGDMTIGDFLYLTGIREEDFDFESETLGGWIIEYLEDFPGEGDVLDYENIHVKVLKTDGLRVEKAEVTIQNP